jgi:hypothetical protein
VVLVVVVHAGELSEDAVLAAHTRRDHVLPHAKKTCLQH